MAEIQPTMYHPRCPRNLVERIVSGEILASEMGAERARWGPFASPLTG
jgi:hypothetical protein